MNKIKKLTWFAAFCSLFQYTREKKLGVYLLANAFGCVIPAFLLVMFLGGHIGVAAYVCINAALRLVFAPVDDYTCDEYAFSKLSSFPLNIFEMMYVRLVAKATQVSEWVFALSVGYIYSTAFGMPQAIAPAVVTVAAIELAEEVVFYLIYLGRNVRSIIAGFLAACAAMVVLAVMCPVKLSVLWTAAIWGGVLVLSVAAMLVLHHNWSRIRPLCARRTASGMPRMPLSSRMMVAASSGSALRRLVCLEWICMLKLKVWDVVSALGYVVVFAAMDGSHSMLYVLIQYFIVDFCFLAGFNYFGTINDNEGMFLLCTVDRKTQIRSKNLALASVLTVISGILTAVLGIIYQADLRTLVLTAVANVFCIAVMILCSSLVSILHFHLNESKKKYTAGNVVIMLVVLILSSIITSFLLAGGMLGAISLIFMAVMTLACVYFSLIDMSLLVGLYQKKQNTMMAALRG